MQQEYTYSRGFRIFVFCLIAPFALMSLLVIYGIIALGIKSPVEASIAFVSIVPCGALVLYCINELLSVVTSDSNGIRYTSFLYRRELLWDAIKGYQWKEGTLVLIPIQKERKKVRVSGQRLGCDKIADWIMARYPDLNNKMTNERVMAAYKADPHYQNKVRMAKYTARAFNIAGFVLMVSCFAFIRPLPFTDFLRWVPLLIIVMLAAIPVALEYHKGWLIVSENKREQTLPGILLAVLFGAAGLFVFSIPVFNIELKILWTAISVIVMVFTSLVVFASRHMKITMGNKIWGVISFLIFFIPAAFGSVVYLNTFFDRSPAQLFETKVYDKRISRGRSTSYYLVVSPWGPVTSKVSISVGRKKYEAANINDVVTMELHQGAFGVPWYTPQILKR